MEHQIYHIVATSGDQLVIGRNNQLPWPKISTDLKHFRTTTAGTTVIMGHHTFDSIGNKPLPNRENFVLSRSNIDLPPGVTLCHSIEEAIEKAPTEKVFIIGGGEVFKETIDKVDGIIMTKIYANYQGDTFYPKIPEFFKEQDRKPLPTSPTEPKADTIFYVNTQKVK